VKRILVVDTRLLCYNLYHRHQPMTEFLQYVYDLIGDLKYSKLVWAFDGRHGSVRRKKLYPEYKAHRAENRAKKDSDAEKQRLKEFNRTYSDMAEYLQEFGTVIYNDDEEADVWSDIISRRYAGDDEYEVCLISSDSDWQMGLVADNIKMFHVSKLEWITKHNIYEVSGKYMEVADVSEYQFLAGLNKENVQGVKGLGIKRYYLAKESELGLFGQIEQWLDTGKYGMRLPDRFDTLEDMYTFNKELLRPVELSDLSLEDRDLFIQQYNSNKVVRTDTVRMLMEEEVFGELVYLPQELKDFYKIK